MKRAVITIGSVIKVSGIDSDHSLLLQKAAMFDNPFFSRAEREGIKVERIFDFSSAETNFPKSEMNFVRVPRGMIDKVSTGLDKLGYKCEFVFRLTLSSELIRDVSVDMGLLQHDDFPDMLRDYQREAVIRMCQAGQGIIEISTGGGKSLIGSSAIRTIIDGIKKHQTHVGSNYAALIVVDRTNLIHQWHRALQMADVKAHEVRVMTVQSLAGKPLPHHDIFILDECHHAGSAATYQDVISRSNAFWRWGLSATPERVPGLLPVVEAQFGKTLFSYEKTDLFDAGHLMKPNVEIYESDFEFDYHPTVKSPTTGRVVKRNNYQQLLKALRSDYDRNALIARIALQNEADGRVVLVASKSTKHLSDIIGVANGMSSGRSADFYFIHGNTKPAVREKIIDSIDNVPGGAVLFTTLGDEALDIPRVDTIVMTYPMRNDKALTQLIGRILRKHDEKFQPLIIDITDPKVGILRSQARDRRLSCYTDDDVGFITRIDADKSVVSASATTNTQTK